MKIVKLIICVLFGLMFINAGLNKFLNYMPMPEMTAEEMKIFGAFGVLTWLMPLIATFEIIGGVLFAIPKTRALGAIVIFPIMVGIIAHHLTLAPQNTIIAVVLMLINLWIIFDNMNKYKPMINEN